MAVKETGIKVVATGADQAAQDIQKYNEAQQALVSVLDAAKIKASEANAAYEGLSRTVDELTAGSGSVKQYGEALDSFMQAFDIKWEADNDVSKLVAEIERLGEVVPPVTKELQALPAATKDLVGGQEAIAAASQQVNDTVVKLNTNMQLAGEVAKAYGISANEASRLIKQGAQEAGVSFGQFAEMVLADAAEAKVGLESIGTTFQQLPKNMNKVVTEANSELLKLIKAEEEASSASKTIFADWMRSTQASFDGHIASIDKVLQAQEKLAASILPGARSGLPSDPSQIVNGNGPANIPVNQQSVQQMQAYTVSTQQAQQATQGFWQANQRATQAQQNLNQNLNWGIQAQNAYFAAQAQNTAAATAGAGAVNKLTLEWEKVFLLLSQYDTPVDALNKISAAQNAGVKPAQLYNQILQEQLDIVSRSIGPNSNWVNIKKQLADFSKANAEALALEEKAQNRVTESATASSRVFFALTLASFGLMEINRQLRESNNDLAPTFEKFTSLMQSVSSFGSAGVFLGSALPGLGAVGGGLLGGLIGVLTQLPQLLDQTSEGTKSLVDAAARLGDQDKAAEMLSNLAAVSKEDAQAALDAAKDNDTLRIAIEGVAKAQQAQENAQGTGSPYPGAAGGQVNPNDIRTTEELAQANLDLAESYVRVAVEQAAVIEQSEKLHEARQREIDKLQEEMGFIEKSTGLTKGEVSTITGYVNAHEDAGDALAQTLTRINDLTKARDQDMEHGHLYVAAIQEQIELAREQAGALLEAAEAEKIHGNEAEKAANALRTYNQAMADAAFRSGQLAQRTDNQIGAAQQQFDNSTADAHQAYLNAIYNADQTMTNRLDDLWQDYANKQFDIQQTLADKQTDIASQLADKLANIQMQLQNSIFDINQDLQNKLDELAYKRQQDISKANDKIADAAKDLARKLFEIERDRIEAIERLSFETSEQLRKAKTDHERDDILRRFRFELGQIDQNANDRKQDAQADFRDKVEQARKERQLADQNYRHEVELAKRLAAQKIAEAERTAAQQTAIAHREAAQQLAIAQREAQQALAAAARRYAEETAIARRNYEQQVEAARRAEEQKNADAARSLQQRLDAIAKAAELERQQIEYTKQKALEAYQEVIKKIVELQMAVAGLLALALKLASVPTGIANIGAAVTANLFDDWIKGIQKGIPGGANGLDMVVPPGFENDTYMVRASSRERVLITPPDSRGGGGSSNVTFNIFDATDPVRVGNVVRQTMVDWTRGN